MGHFVPLSRATVERLWSDRSITREQIAAQLNISARALTVRVKGYGMDLRGHATKNPIITDQSLFAEMWMAGVASDEIARALGVGSRTVFNTRERLGLPARRPGTKPKTTLQGFFEDRMATRLREAMRATAAQEQAQLVLAEMVDVTASSRRGKA